MRILKPSLFVYECVRFTLFILIILILGSKQQFSIIIVFTAPCILFPLMALFIWLDAVRNKAYLPLFLAGKCIYIFALIVWFILSKQAKMFTSNDSVANLAQFILSGDLFTLAAVLVIKNDTNELTEKYSEKNESIIDTEDR